MIEITFFNQTKTDIEKLKETIEQVFLPIKADYIFSIIFVDKREIKQLNKRYRKLNKITDVLSFPSEEEDYLGDIFICLPQAIKQAEDFQHSLAREIGFLAVHGYLHLLGYDHQTAEAEKLMREKQEAILQQAALERNSK